MLVLTGAPAATLGEAADVTLDCRVDEEACPLNLAPTASTTAALALGDALAMVLLVRKGFRQEDFANLHPGGKLGKRLMRVEQLMHAGDGLPVVSPATGLRDVIYEMSRKGLGMTCVVDASGTLTGLITDGDLRRHMGDPDILDRPAEAVMTRSPVTIAGDILAAEALNLMERRKITSLIVVDADRRLEGVVHLHDLWRTEMF
jgi:arabinose-5-phosphate isomerase